VEAALGKRISAPAHKESFAAAGTTKCLMPHDNDYDSEDKADEQKRVDVLDNREWLELGKQPNECPNGKHAYRKYEKELQESAPIVLPLGTHVRSNELELNRA
jgi:hypothetical protein